MSVLSVMLMCRDALAGTNDSFQFDIPKQALTRSIIEIGKVSEISIIVPSHLLNGIKAKQLDGVYTPKQALEILLRPTDLTFRAINRKVIAIVPKPKDDSSDPITEYSVEELVIIGRQVTGSFLDRTDLHGSSPIDIITGHELRISGSQSVAEFLRFIPAVSGNSTSTAISNGGDGTATVTLRGLPANNTLVLLNGIRINAQGLNGDSVDLNSIPSAAVDRIEILKDGASATYGTDAIAGVINIVLKKEYDGFQLEQYYGSSYKNDLETASTHLLWGKSGDKGAFLISAQHFDQNGIFSRERSVSANADGRPQGGVEERSTATPNSRITLNDGSTVTLDEATINTPTPRYRDATKDDLFNFFSQTSTISPSLRQSVFLSGHLALSDTSTLSLDASYNKTKATITLASTPIFTAFESEPITVSRDNIFNPFGEDITDVRRRVLELPPRQQENTSEAKRISITLDGLLNEAVWKINGNWSRTSARESVANLLSLPRTAQALGPSSNCPGTDLNGCQPLDLFGPLGSINEQQLAFIRSSSSNRGVTSLKGITGSINDSIFELPAGPIQAAVGFDIRREKIESVPTGENALSENIGNPLGSETVGSRSIYEVFLETHLPIIKYRPGVYSFDIEAALRHSKYSDFGNNTSPKFGIRYRPAANVLIRSTYSEGFRAPSLGELFAGDFQSQLPLVDPCSTLVSIASLPGCIGQTDDTRTQYLTTFLGEPNLAPETSRSYNIGIVWTPRFNKDLHISIDQFNIDQRNIVSSDAQLILDRNALFGDFSDLVVRDTNGEITNLFSPFINIGERKISGIDTTIRYIYKFKNKGYLNYTLNTSYLQEYAFKLDSNSPFENLAGTFEDAANEGSGALPKWKANTGVFFAYKIFEFNYSINYISSVSEEIPRSRTNERRTISSWVTHDTQATFKLGKRKNIKLTFGADNIFNKAPPFSAAAFNDNYDGRTYDIRGQFLYTRLVYLY